jgi:hypothetical protein
MLEVIKNIGHWPYEIFLRLFCRIYLALNFTCHISKPFESISDCVYSQDIEAMEDLSMNLSLIQDLSWYLAILRSFSFNKIDNIVDSTIFQSKLLLFISTIYYWCCQVICCFSFTNVIEDVVYEVWQVYFFLGFFNFWTLRFSTLFLW